MNLKGKIPLIFALMQFENYLRMKIIFNQISFFHVKNESDDIYHLQFKDAIKIYNKRNISHNQNHQAFNHFL